MNWARNFSKKPKLFQRTVGLPVAAFKELSSKLKDTWDKAEMNREKAKLRVKEVGGGRSYHLASMKQKLLVVLIYYKAYLRYMSSFTNRFQHLLYSEFPESASCPLPPFFFLACHIALRLSL